VLSRCVARWLLLTFGGLAKAGVGSRLHDIFIVGQFNELSNEMPPRLRQTASYLQPNIIIRSTYSFSSDHKDRQKLSKLLLSLQKNLPH
jgi:hypothetical protein